jgi:hypothetical protein
MVEHQKQERIMSPRRAAAVVLCAIVAVLVWLVLSGCATKRKPIYSALPPPAPSPVVITRYIESSKGRGEKTRTIVETQIKEIEVIKEVVDEVSKAKLTEVQAELLRASAELVQLRTDLERTEAEAAVIVAQADALRQWGIGEQQIAQANAEGWREEEKRYLAARDKLIKAEAVANKRGNLVGLLGGSSLALLGLKFVSLAVPWTLALPAVGAIAGYFGARFIL